MLDSVGGRAHTGEVALGDRQAPSWFRPEGDLVGAARDSPTRGLAVALVVTSSLMVDGRLSPRLT